MTPHSKDSFHNQLNFGTIKGRKVIANFSGGRITSDARIVLLAELDKKLKITTRFSEFFKIIDIYLMYIIPFVNYWHKEFTVLS